mmetsp:Transcript_12178/g.21718  ORF Transcript_12178/g.21718 Transcript_12178/m.21718 type:complete len:232 (-) Transcript_12178:124-819(-)
MAANTSGLSTSQGTWSSLLTVTKSGPRKTPCTPPMRNTVVTRGEFVVLSPRRNSMAAPNSSGSTVSPVKNFRLEGFGVSSTSIKSERTPSCKWGNVPAPRARAPMKDGAALVATDRVFPIDPVLWLNLGEATVRRPLLAADEAAVAAPAAAFLHAERTAALAIIVREGRIESNPRNPDQRPPNCLISPKSKLKTTTLKRTNRGYESRCFANLLSLLLLLVVLYRYSCGGWT